MILGGMIVPCPRHERWRREVVQSRRPASKYSRCRDQMQRAVAAFAARLTVLTRADQAIEWIASLGAEISEPRLLLCMTSAGAWPRVAYRRCGSIQKEA